VDHEYSFINNRSEQRKELQQLQRHEGEFEKFKEDTKNTWNIASEEEFTSCFDARQAEDEFLEDLLFVEGNSLFDSRGNLLPRRLRETDEEDEDDEEAEESSQKEGDNGDPDEDDSAAEESAESTTTNPEKGSSGSKRGSGSSSAGGGGGDSISVNTLSMVLTKSNEQMASVLKSVVSASLKKPLDLLTQKANVKDQRQAWITFGQQVANHNDDLSIADRTSKIDPKIRTSIQIEVDANMPRTEVFVGGGGTKEMIVDPKFDKAKFWMIWLYDQDGLGYDSGTWRQRMTHEHFFALMSVFLGISFPEFNAQRGGEGEMSHRIGQLFGKPPATFGLDTLEFLKVNYEQLCTIYPEVFHSMAIIRAKSAEDRKRDEVEMQKGASVVVVPTQSERQERKKIYAAVCNIILRKVAAYPTGRVYAITFFRTRFNTLENVQIWQWYVVDWMHTLLASVREMISFGETAGQLGLVLDPSRGTFTFGDEASLQRKETAFRVIERSSKQDEEEDRDAKKRGRDKIRKKKPADSAKAGEASSAKRFRGAERETKLDGGSQASQATDSTAGEGKPKSKQVAEFDASTDLKKDGTCAYCPNKHGTNVCHYKPGSKDFKGTFKSIHSKGIDSTPQGKLMLCQPCNDCFICPDDCAHPQVFDHHDLLSCESCETDSCQMHNRIAVTLSVSDQDRNKAEATGAAAAEPEAEGADSAHPAPSSQRKRTEATTDVSVDTTARLDTGSSMRNFISGDLADELIAKGSKVVSASGGVNGRFDDEPKRMYSRALIIKYGFFNSLLKTTESILIKAVVMEKLDSPLIIGIHTIGKHGLICKQKPELCHPLCGHRPTTTTRTSVQEASSARRLRRLPVVAETAARVLETASKVPRGLVEKSTQTECDLCQASASNTTDGEETTLAECRQGPTADETAAVMSESQSKSTGQLPGLANQSSSAWSQRTHIGEGTSKSEGCELCQFHSSSRDLFGSASDGESDEESPSSLADLLPTVTGGGASQESMSEMIAKIIFEGESEHQERLRNLCTEFGDVFSSYVREQPAGVPAMSLTVDYEKFRKTAGRARSPRPQSQSKLAELKRMIEELLRLKVIRTSTAEVVSQVLLVVKKGTTKLRFCIDYRALNDATLGPEAWPIPNIQDLLRRLGDKRPKFFGVMDLTSGYHQAPLSESAKRWTAFVTAFGLFEWNRVPMGLMGAPSYFSRVMMTNVLGDLLMKAVEVYLDDFIVFGSTFEEFYENLQRVFQRFREAGVTLNPAKCRFGMSKVEYVGHTIDEEGLHFSRAKIDSVLDFPKPTTKGAMKTFLGMVTHMHSHIRNLSIVETPLIRLIGEGYTKAKRKHVLVWDAEAEQAFEDIKVAIDKLPKLFFEDGALPVYVQTDASYYGIGAYMFQLAPDGSHRPICFISKTLSKDQRRWGIPDKEAYAIFYAVKRWEHLLRDRHFVLQTDHKNLAYLNFEGTAKVRRWKMLLQEFNFDIEYLRGEDNPVADSFSRNCAEEESFDSDLKQLEIDEEFNSLIEFESEQTEEFLAFEQQEPIPPAIRSAIASVHNSFVGHNGVRRTNMRLKKAGHSIKHARGWIERFILECPFCQKQSYKSSKKVTPPFTLAQTKVMQELHIDTIGPLDKDRHGYTYVLTVIDAFSRWVMAYPLRTLTAEEFLIALIEHIGIFGTPMTIKTDGGSQLSNELVKQVLALLKTEHKISVAYSHEENGIVERANRELIRYLRAMIFEANRSDRWSEILPFAQRICNAEVVSSLGVAPAHVLFGAAIDLDRSILNPNVPLEAHEHKDMSDYVQSVIAHQKDILAYAKANQEAKDSEHIDSGRGLHLTDYGVGTLVTVSYPQDITGKSRPPSKLLTQRKGPYEVVAQTGTTYQLQHCADKTKIFRHVSQLELFYYDVATVDPMAIAAKDLTEFVVEDILDHEPKRNAARNRADLQFLVKWKDYDESENSWVDWHSLTNNSVCHAYCLRTVGLKSLIAKRYREPEESDEE
jgi:hypothetical protein